MPTKTTKSSKKTTRRPVARTVRTVNAVAKNAKNTTNKRRENSITSLTNGISVLRYALEKGLSVSAAAKVNGHGRNYVSDIKARIEENYSSGNITKTLYTTFKSLSSRYDKSSK